MSTFPPPGKISADAHGHEYLFQGNFDNNNTQYCTIGGICDSLRKFTRLSLTATCN